MTVNRPARESKPSTAVQYPPSKTRNFTNFIRWDKIDFIDPTTGEFLCYSCSKLSRLQGRSAKTQPVQIQIKQVAYDKNIKSVKNINLNATNYKLVYFSLILRDRKHCRCDTKTSCIKKQVSIADIFSLHLSFAWCQQINAILAATSIMYLNCKLSWRRMSCSLGASIYR